MPTLNQVKILYGLHALFFCVLVALVWYQIQGSRQSLGTAPLNQAGIQQDATIAEEIAKVTVGSNADNPATKRLGTITQVSGDSLTLEEDPSGTVYAVSISYSTKVELLGAAKDRATYQKELDAYYAQVKLLAEDPIKNKLALEALTLPQTNESKLGSITDLAVGDSIIAIAEVPISDKSFVAVKIIKALPQAR